MEKTSIGNKIGFGGAGLSAQGGGYGFGSILSPKDLIEQAIESGITVYDTAPIYGFNHSEITLGRELKNIREKVQIVSKSGVSWHDNKRVNMTNDPKITRSMLESSLKNLNTDYIDIYMIHWPDKRVDIRYPLEVLAKAQVEGKIKCIGLCNTTKEDLGKALELVKLEYLQSECNFFSNPLIEFSEEIAQYEITTMGWGTLDKGILAGSVTEDSIFEKSDARSWAAWWKKSNWKEKVRLVNKAQERFNLNIIDLALSYSFNNVDISLCGFKKTKHIQTVINSLNNQIDSKTLFEVEKFLRIKD